MNTALPVFLLQNNYFDRLSRLVQPCLDFCRERGHDFIDRSLTDDFDPDALDVEWDAYPGVIVYGSVGWTKRCADSRLGIRVPYDPISFSSTSWVPLFGNEALNGDGRAMPVSEARARLALSERLHLRPDSDDKAFGGGVYDDLTWSQMEQKRRIDMQRPISDDLVCWASPVKPICSEHRCWFVDGEFVETSTYRRDGRQHIERAPDLAVLREGMRLAAIHLPNDTVVMDIAETDDGFKVIEFNPVTSSGWYAADVDVILDAWSNMLRRGRRYGHETAPRKVRTEGGNDRPQH